DGYARLRGSPRHIRTLALGSGCLDIHDRIVGGHHPWVSRLRVDADARVRITGEGHIHRRDDRWFPRHGDACPAGGFEQQGGGEGPAVVFEQQGGGEEARGVVWRVEW